MVDMPLNKNKPNQTKREDRKLKLKTSKIRSTKQQY